MWNGERYKKEGGKWKYQGKAHTGTVLGHTKSGKSVYENHNHPAHKDFSDQDHTDAANIHAKKTEDSSLSNEQKENHNLQRVNHMKSVLGQPAATKEEYDKTTKKDDVDFVMHDESEHVARHAGITHEEYQATHPDTKKELTLAYLKDGKPKSSEKELVDVDAFLDDFILDDIDWDNEAKTKKDLRKLAYDTVTNILVDKGAIKTISDLTPEQKKKLDDYVNDEWKTYRDSLEEE